MVRRQGETRASDLDCPDVRSALEIYIERVGESGGVLAANVDKVSPSGGGKCLRRYQRTLSLPAVRCRRKRLGEIALRMTN
jgi:hypothetical protein